MAKWLVKQRDGKERRVPKSVAMLALRRNQATQPDPNARVIVERVPLPSNDPDRFLYVNLQALIRIDPRKGCKKRYQIPRGLLIQYPLKDQRGRVGRDRDPGTAARIQARLERAR